MLLRVYEGGATKKIIYILEDRDWGKHDEG